MSKKGSALMQVLVIGLVVAAFSVMILRYAITRSANLTRTNRILQSQIVADSCLDQYMAYQAAAELSGRAWSSNTINVPACKYYNSEGNLVFSTTTISEVRKDVDESKMIVFRFAVPVSTFNQ